MFSYFFYHFLLFFMVFIYRFFIIFLHFSFFCNLFHCRFIVVNYLSLLIIVFFVFSFFILINPKVLHASQSIWAYEHMMLMLSRCADELMLMLMQMSRWCVIFLPFPNPQFRLRNALTGWDPDKEWSKSSGILWWPLLTEICWEGVR